MKSIAQLLQDSDRSQTEVVPTTVWKFPLPLTDKFVLSMPSGAKILRVASQHNMGCMWARVDPTQPRHDRQFILRGTGHIIELDCWYIGSFETGSFVWHVFENTLS